MHFVSSPGLRFTSLHWRKRLAAAALAEATRRRRPTQRLNRPKMGVAGSLRNAESRAFGILGSLVARTAGKGRAGQPHLVMTSYFNSPYEDCNPTVAFVVSRLNTGLRSGGHPRKWCRRGFTIQWNTVKTQPISLRNGQPCPHSVLAGASLVRKKVQESKMSNILGHP